MKITHKHPFLVIWGFLKENLSYTMTFCVVIGSLITGNVFYAFFSADIKINNEKMKTLENKIEQLNGQLVEARTFKQIIESHLKAELAIYKAEKEVEKEKRLEKVLERIERIK